MIGVGALDAEALGRPAQVDRVAVGERDDVSNARRRAVPECGAGSPTNPCRRRRRAPCSSGLLVRVRGDGGLGCPRMEARQRDQAGQPRPAPCRPLPRGVPRALDRDPTRTSCGSCPGCAASASASSRSGRPTRRPGTASARCGSTASRRREAAFATEPYRSLLTEDRKTLFSEAQSCFVTEHTAVPPPAEVSARAQYISQPPLTLIVAPVM